MWERVCELSTFGVRQIVEFAKKVPGFTDLVVSDQAVILKSSCLEVLVRKPSLGASHLRMGYLMHNPLDQT